MLVRFDIKGKAEDAHKHVQGALDATATAQRAHPGFVVEEFGDASAHKALDKTLAPRPRASAEKLVLPLTLIILLIAFGALVAAGVRCCSAFSAVLATIGLSARSASCPAPTQTRRR